jgi:outer membrane receptor protein involved in Fe transport
VRFFSRILFIAAATAVSAYGQIALEVKDPSGLAMEARGTITNLAGGAERTFHTDSNGTYRFSDLTAGRYRLVVTRSGFATQSELLQVRAGPAETRRITLSILPPPQSSIDVIAAMPLAGVNLLRNEIAGAVQTASESDLESSGAVDLSDFLNRRLHGVHVNEIQGNPFEADVNYRGYTASPLLGTAQGLSVYMDGVRINQPFGDVVSWDLIPQVAIADMTLMPGSNPLFGLNTLGGALSVHTKDGRTQPGTSLQLSGGSFGRKVAEFEHGGASANGLSWYLAGNLFFEDGWRDASPSNVRQFFGKLGRQRAKTSLDFTAAYANNLLTGNGLQEQRFVARDYSSIYNKPDVTGNRSAFLNLSVRHTPNTKLSLSGNVYYRYIHSRSLNADMNEESLDESVYQPSAADVAALTTAGYKGFPASGANASNTPFPFWRCIAQALQHDETSEKCNGLLTRANSRQHNYGISGQATWFGSPYGKRNQFTAGAAFDRSLAGFSQAQQFAYLNSDHSFTEVNAFADGTTNSNGDPYDTRVNLDGRIHTASVYATDTLSAGRAVSITVSGRYNRTVVDNADRIHAPGSPDSLSGNHSFGRFNPAAGITFSPSRFVNVYASYSEGSRAPTAIELGCADPDQPCKLPNAMAGDPPLRQVVTRTIEAGVRSGEESRLTWSAGWFRAQNNEDILFVASTQTGYGYFKNFGQTRRQGAELEARRRLGRVTAGVSYTLLDATYQSAETVGGAGNSASDGPAKGLDGDISIYPGAHMPLMPRHTGKAFADVQATKKLIVDLGLVAVSSSYVRGNENNAHQPDGKYYLGPGVSPGYAVLNAGARYHASRRLELFVRVNNLLDRHYYSAAQLGVTGYTDAGNFIARPFPAVAGQYPLVHATFFAPGAPRAAWGGVRLRF